MEYPLDWEEVERLKKFYADRGLKVELVWMTPDEFLSKVPHPATALVPAIFDLRAKWFSETSIGSIRRAIIKNVKMNPLMLDYSRMVDGYPAHEGRHRAYVSKTYGIEKVPVLVIRRS